MKKSKIREIIEKHATGFTGIDSTGMPSQRMRITYTQDSLDDLEKDLQEYMDDYKLKIGEVYIEGSHSHTCYGTKTPSEVLTKIWRKHEER